MQNLYVIDTVSWSVQNMYYSSIILLFFLFYYGVRETGSHAKTKDTHTTVLCKVKVL